MKNPTNQLVLQKCHSQRWGPLMGSKVGKILLPLVAIGTIGALTGGFGLLGAPAAAAGEVAATTAATTAATVGESVGSAIIPGTMSAMSSAGLPMSLMAPASTASAGEAAFLASAQAAAAAPVAAAQTAPWYSSAFSFFKTNKDIIGLGFSGMSALSQGASAKSQALAQENMLKLQASEDALALAQRERDSQLKLSQVLATQNNMFAARGVDPSSGSAMQAQDAAQSQAERQLSIYGLYNDIQTASYNQRRKMAARAAANAYPGALLDFGKTAFSVVKV